MLFILTTGIPMFEKKGRVEVEESNFRRRAQNRREANVGDEQRPHRVPNPEEQNNPLRCTCVCAVLVTAESPIEAVA